MSLVSLDEIKAARQRIKAVARVTPLIDVSPIVAATGQSLTGAAAMVPFAVLTTIAEGIHLTPSRTGAFMRKLPSASTSESSAGANFTFSVRLTNDTAEDQTFSLTATGPAGWDVEARPSGQTQAASANVTAGGNTTINVTATAPEGTEAGDYPIAVQAVGASSTADTELIARVVGSFDLNVTTQSGVLNVSGNAGSTIDQTISVENTGTGPLENVTLAGTAPSGWTVTFDPPNTLVQPGVLGPQTCVWK